MTITTIDEVKFVGQFTNEYEDTEIETEIDIVESDLYSTYSLPKRSQFSIDSDYSVFYIDPNKVYEIVRVQVAVETDVDPSGYISVATSATTWTFSSKTNYLTLAPEFLALYDTKIVRVQYIPVTYNTIASVITALNLIDPTIIVDGEETVTPLVARLRARLTRLRQNTRPKIILKSSDYADYDKYDYIGYNQSTLR